MDENTVVMVSPTSSAEVEALIFVNLSNQYNLIRIDSNEEALNLKEKNPKVILLKDDLDNEKLKKVIVELKQKYGNRVSIMVISRDFKEQEEKEYLTLGVNDLVHLPIKMYILKLRIDVQLNLINYIIKIEELGLTDQLTGLPNRRHFDNYMESSFKNCKENNIPITVMICDIDHFKNFNDSYGHEVGDEVLKFLGNKMKEQFSSYFISRWGGEEFVIVIEGIDKEKAISIGEKFRQLIEQSELESKIIKNQKLKLTISVGIINRIIENESIEYLLNSADECLYKAKETGRNKVVVC